MPLHSNVPRYARTRHSHSTYNKKPIEKSTENLFVQEDTPETLPETIPEDIQESVPENVPENVQEDIPEIINNNE